MELEQEIAKLLGVPTLALLLASVVFKQLLDHEKRISRLEGYNDGSED